MVRIAVEVDLELGAVEEAGVGRQGVVVAVGVAIAVHADRAGQPAIDLFGVLEPVVVGVVVVRVGADQVLVVVRQAVIVRVGVVGVAEHVVVMQAVGSIRAEPVEIDGNPPAAGFKPVGQAVFIGVDGRVVVRADQAYVGKLWPAGQLNSVGRLKGDQHGTLIVWRDDRGDQPVVHHPDHARADFPEEDRRTGHEAASFNGHADAPLGGTLLGFDPGDQQLLGIIGRRFSVRRINGVGGLLLRRQDLVFQE